MNHATMISTVDVVLLTLFKERLHVVLQRRENEPFKGALALPGGYIHPEEDSDSMAAAKRVLKAKTGIVSPYLEQLYTFASAARDPRGWSVSIAYYALVNYQEFMTNDVVCELLPVDELPDLSFDHNKIVEKAVRRLRDKSNYSTLPCYLLPEEFTLAELHNTYVKVVGPWNMAAFRRKVAAWDFIEEIEGKKRIAGGAPAQLFRIKPQTSIELFNRPVRES